MHSLMSRAWARDEHGAGVRLHFSDPDLEFLEKKNESEFGMNGMVYIECI